MEPRLESLIEAASRPYLEAGRFHWHFARAKLKRDPAFLAVLRRGWLPDRGILVDVGCGRGLLLALIAAARERHAAGEWPDGYPPPPASLELHGIELLEGHARVARRALAGRARVALGDIRAGGLPVCSAIAMLDVLMYLEESDQEKVLRSAAAALQRGGLMLLREADAGAGLAFRVTRWSERALEALRGRPRSRLHYRPAQEWALLLESLGFAVSAEPMSAGTPFANVLFVCTKRKGLRSPALPPSRTF